MLTPKASDTYPDPDISLYGGNAKAFDSRAEEQLLAGPAGTGKTLCNLAVVYWIARIYPGARILIVRKTRESLTETVLVTWERDILTPAHPILTRRPVIRRVRQSYTFRNGSEVVVGGIDKPAKILSSEFDCIYVPEATDLTVEDWETLSGRLRAARVPYQQMIADCNPTTPHHWIYKRYQSGLLTKFDTTHKDNPRYWDREKQEWTPLGKQYIARLERMTGNRKERFLKGLWVAAEGVVYAFDPDIHQLPKDWTPPASWPRVWGIDWGESSPTVLGLFAIDPEGRMHHYREVYQTHLRADKLGAWAKREIESGREPSPHAIVCDHDLEKKSDFETASGLSLTLAEKSERERGIQAMQARFDVQDDGKPRIYLKEGALAHEPDRVLVGSGRPCNFIEEIVGYTWNPDFLKDEPIAENDHACFVAGTMIETERGPRPIESIREGEWVWTRQGLRPVLAAGMTSESATIWRLETNDGRFVEGTANHPVHAPLRGFVSLDDLRYNEALSDISEDAAWTCYRSHRQTALSAFDSTASFTGDTRKPSNRRTATTSPAGWATGIAVTPAFTGTSGRLTTDRFQTATTLTTSTATRSTMPSAICKPSPSPNTTLNTLWNWLRLLVSGWRISRRSNAASCPNWRPSGTDPRQGGRGIPSTRSRSWLRCRWWMRFVNGANRHLPSSDSPRSERDFAASTAKPPLVATPGLTMRLGSAPSAVLISPSTDTLPVPIAARPVAGWLHGSERIEHAPVGAEPCSPSTHVPPSGIVRVRAVTSTGRREPVYNLTVEDVHEYYANGVLVSNCDQTRYVVVYCDKHFPSPLSRAHKDAYGGDLSGKRMPGRVATPGGRR